MARDPLTIKEVTSLFKMVRILHTAGRNCSDYQTCATRVLGLQGEHVGIGGLPDIAYNFLVGGDGNVYIGRGADVQNDFRLKKVFHSVSLLIWPFLDQILLTSLT